MRKHIRSIIIIVICLIVGTLLGLYLNDFNSRMQSQQTPDYLHMPTETYWMIAIPTFIMMIMLVGAGYVFSKKVKDSDI
jgi:heme/copper-type cytochrome/quinol oxidase subunit 2